jgi:hypothetical protein
MPIIGTAVIATADIALLMADLPLQGHKDILLVMGIGLIGFWFLVRAHKRRAGETTLAPEEQIERFRQSRGMQGDLETLMAEIEEMTQRLGTRLDQKSARLERLLAEADRRIAELRPMSGESPTPGAGGYPGARGAAPPPAPLKFPPRGNPAPLSDDPLSRSVYELFDQGHAPIDIAKKLNEQIGKVELILALRRA